MSRLVNLTPHTVNLSLADGTIVGIPSEGEARVNEIPGDVFPGSYEGFEFPTAGPSRFGEITGLPAPVDGVTLIVSLVVASALQAQGSTRPDVVRPGTGPKDGAIRFDNGPQKGQVKAVTRLIRAC